MVFDWFIYLPSALDTEFSNNRSLMIRLLYSNSNCDPSKNIRKGPDWAKYAPTSKCYQLVK